MGKLILLCVLLFLAVFAVYTGLSVTTNEGGIMLYIGWVTLFIFLGFFLTWTEKEKASPNREHSNRSESLWQNGFASIEAACFVCVERGKEEIDVPTVFLSSKTEAKRFVKRSKRQEKTFKAKVLKATKKDRTTYPKARYKVKYRY